MLIVSRTCCLPKCSRLELMRYARMSEWLVACVRRQLNIKEGRKVLIRNDILESRNVESPSTLEYVLIRPTWILELHPTINDTFWIFFYHL